MKHAPVSIVLAAATLGCGDASRERAAPSFRGEAPRALHAQAPASGAFRSAVRATLPTLVFVQVEALPPASERVGGPPVPPWLPEEPRPGLRVGTGSGFVLSSDGYVLTNNHVVDDAVSVTVVLADNRRFEAAVMGRDPDTDIALLRVQADSLSPATLGDADSLEVGDWVLALGYPLGLSLTVTAGIVSGTGRSLGLAELDGEAVAPIEHFIQTDAAINPGNSGGPLVDLAGRVVGVNSAIVSPTGYYSGYGFAVPINLARRVAQDLIRFGEVRRPRLGLRLADVTPADAEVYGLPSVAGAEVVGVDPNGPAGAAGVQLGDVVVALDAAPVRTSVHLESLVAQRRPEEQVRLDLIRYGRPASLVVTLGRFPSRPRNARATPRHEGTVSLGFVIVATRTGVRVADVDRFSAAARAGVRPGQRIVALNGRPVRTGADFGAALGKLGAAKAISLRVLAPELGETIINYRLEPLHRER